MMQPNRSLFSGTSLSPHIILNTLPDPVLAYRPDDFSLLYLNQAAHELFALPESTTQHYLSQLLHGAGLDESLLHTWQNQHQSHRQFHDEMILFDREFSVYCSPIPDQDAPHWLCVLHDITDAKSRETLHTQIIQIVSHDLKNPLNIISGLAQILELDTSGEQQKWVKQILKNTQRMETLITNLLNIERMNAGSLEFTDIDPADFITALVNEYQADAEARQQAITLHINAPHLKLCADKPQLHQALGNLLSNAIKYTPQGGQITVTLSHHDHHAQFMIADTGVGIPPDAQDKLYQPFFRVQNESTRGISGTGLGLNLAKSIITAHGGDISLHSIEGVGSTFTVELPVTLC